MKANTISLADPASTEQSITSTVLNLAELAYSESPIAMLRELEDIGDASAPRWPARFISASKAPKTRPR